MWVIVMKFVLLTFIVLAIVMICGAAAGPSNNAGPELNMDELTEEDCRACHDSTSYLRNTDHYYQHYVEPYSDCTDIIECHNPSGPKKLNCMKSDCHHSGGFKPVTDHHVFDEIFEDGQEWDCFTCHEKGVPR